MLTMFYNARCMANGKVKVNRLDFIFYFHEVIILLIVIQDKKIYKMPALISLSCQWFYNKVFKNRNVVLFMFLNIILDSLLFVVWALKWLFLLSFDIKKKSGPVPIIITFSSLKVLNKMVNLIFFKTYYYLIS